MSDSDNDHALLAPSSAARLVACPGSRKLAALYPQESTIEAQEGTAAHWAAAEMLYGRPVAVGQVAGNGVTLTDEMIDGAEMYATAIFDRGCVSHSGIERMVKNDWFHANNYGTPDYWFYDAGRKTLEIFDFKHGHGYIEVEGNWQLINYAGLILASLCVDGNLDQAIRVVMTIVQPRNYHRDGPIRTWSVMASDLRPYFNKLRLAFEIAMTDDAPVMTSDQCEYCPGRHACEAATAGGYNAVKHAYSSVPLVMSPGAMGLELRTLRRAAKMLEARITGLEEQVLSTIVRGVGVPHFAIDYAPGRTVWGKPITEVISLGEMMGVDVRDIKALTPKQAIKAGLPAELVEAYSFTPSGAGKLIESSGSIAAKVFSR